MLELGMTCPICHNELDCDEVDRGDVIQRGNWRCEWCRWTPEIGIKLRRYSFLSGYSMRNDQEDAEMLEIKNMLDKVEMDPGWTIVPRK